MCCPRMAGTAGTAGSVCRRTSTVRRSLGAFGTREKGTKAGSPSSTASRPPLLALFTVTRSTSRSCTAVAAASAPPPGCLRTGYRPVCNVSTAHQCLQHLSFTCMAATTASEGTPCI